MAAPCPNEHVEAIIRLAKLGFQNPSDIRRRLAGVGIKVGRKTISDHVQKWRWECDKEIEVRKEWNPVPPAEPSVEPPPPPPEPIKPTPVDEAIDRVARTRDLRRERDELMAIAGEKSFRAFLEGILRDVAPRFEPIEPFEPPTPGNDTSEETLLMLLSDWHAFEEVKPDRVMGFNEFTGPILCERVRRLLLTQLSIKDRLERGRGWAIRKAVVGLNGDFISGTIHEVERHSDASNVVHAAYATGCLLAAYLRDMAPHYDDIYVPCTSGNHGRMPDARRMQQKDPTRNWDTLIYLFAMSALKDVPNVRFDIPDSYFIRYDIEGWNFLQFHGHDIKSWNSIPYYGIDRFGRNMNALYNSRSERIDYFLVSHFHSLGGVPSSGGETFVNGCFPAGTLISVSGGVKPIEELRHGDQVISREGTTQWVEETLKREASEGLVELGIKGFYDPIQATPNHLVWASKGDSTECVCRTHTCGECRPVDGARWIEAGMLSPGDWVHVPSLAPGRLEIGEELAWAFGLFLAEGHTIVEGGASKRHHRIEFSMHINEVSVLERARAVLADFLGKPGRISTRPTKTTSHLTFSVDRQVAADWRESFGHGAAAKHLRPMFYSLVPSERAAIVRGWMDGDGCERITKDGNQVVVGRTISPQLAWGMFTLANSEGHHPTIKRLSKGGHRKNDSYAVIFNVGQDSAWVNGERFVRVCHRRRLPGPTTVYDIETSEHTFVANGVGVHNSVIGGTEFSVGALGRCDRPAQWMFLVHPEHGVTSRWPLLAESRKPVEPYPLPAWPVTC